MLVAHRPKGRQAKRVFAAICIGAVGAAIGYLRESISARDPALNVRFLAGLALFLLAVGVFFVASVAWRAASGAPVLRADGRGVRFQTWWLTVELPWVEVERVQIGHFKGGALLLVVPRRPPEWLKVAGRVPGGFGPVYVVSGDELDAPVAELAAQLESLRAS